MKQVIQDFKTGDVRVVVVPRPQVDDGSILVRTDCSCVSAGTEKSMIELGKKGYIAKAKERPDLAKKVIESARNDGLVSTYKTVMSRLEEARPLGYSCCGEVVAVGSYDNSVYLLDAASGDRVWRFRSGNRVFASPALTQDAVIFSSTDGYVYSIARNSGTKNWEYRAGGKLYSSPTVSPNAVFVGSTDGYLYSLDRANGQQRWRFEAVSPIYATPTAAGDTVFFAADLGTVYALD